MLERMSGEPMLCRAGPVIPKRCKQHRDVVVAVCSLAWHLGTQLLFWRGCLMHVVCVLLQALCIFGLNCFLAGLSDAMRAMTFDRRKVVVDITFAACCEVNIEFVEWLLCEAVDAMFCL